MPTFQVAPARVKEVLRFLKTESEPRFRRLDDLTAVDESARREREHYPDYTLVYQLLSFDPPRRVRLKVPLTGPGAGDPQHHRHLAVGQLVRARSLRHVRHPFYGPPPAMAPPHAPRLGGAPPQEELPGPGHRPCRPTPMRTPEAPAPGRRGVHGGAGWPEDQYVLNIGPHHTSTHGLIRFILALRRRRDHDAGHGHRLPPPGGGEDRRAPVLAPVHPLHRPGGLSDRGGQQSHLSPGGGATLAGIKVPDRAQFIRVMLTEFFRLKQPPGLVFHLYPGHRGHDPHLLLLCRSGKRSWTSSS